MGRTLGVIADRIDAQSFGLRVAVHEAMGANLTRLVLVGDDLVGTSTDPCDVTAFRVSRTDFRHYTPAALDPVAGEVTIIVHRHGAGQGEELIAGWSVGDEVLLCRWSSTRGFRWTDGEAPVVLLGDSTVISLAMSMSDRAAREERTLLAVLEVDADDVEAVRELVPGAVVVAAGDEPGLTLDDWLDQHRDRVTALEDPVVHLAGHGQSIQRQRTFLRAACGLDRRQIRTQPYWATGRSGL